MIHAKILTNWTKEDMGEGELANAPVFPFAWCEGDSWTDISATPSANLTPDPNLILIEAWVSEATYGKILNHPEYGEAAVYMSEEIVENDESGIVATVAAKVRSAYRKRFPKMVGMGTWLSDYQKKNPEGAKELLDKMADVFGRN